jgi:hypothetical protein
MSRSFKFLVLTFLAVFLLKVEATQTYRFKSAYCKSHNESVLKFHECKVKVHSRNSSSVSIKAQLMEPVMKPVFVRTSRTDPRKVSNKAISDQLEGLISVWHDYAGSVQSIGRRMVCIDGWQR